MTRKLIIECWLSLDGYASDKNGGLDFFSKHVRASYDSVSGINFLNSIDTLLFGRNTYEQFSGLWPGRSIERDLLAEKMNTLDKIVFSGSLSHAPWGSWPQAFVEERDVVSTVKTLKALPGKNMVLWGSITLAQMLMKENLADEYRLHLCPVLTGGGRKFFTNEMDSSLLSLKEVGTYQKNIVLLNYTNPSK